MPRRQDAARFSKVAKLKTCCAGYLRPARGWSHRFGEASDTPRFFKASARIAGRAPGLVGNPCADPRGRQAEQGWEEQEAGRDGAFLSRVGSMRITSGRTGKEAIDYMHGFASGAGSKLQDTGVKS